MVTNQKTSRAKSSRSEQDSRRTTEARSHNIPTLMHPLQTRPEKGTGRATGTTNMANAKR